MQDEWFGHRDPFTGEPDGDKDEWLDWDFALVNAFQTIEDYSDEYGLLVWERDDEAVEVDAIRKVHKFKAQVERIQNGKRYKPIPGEYYTPKMTTRRKDEDGNPKYQTYSEWVAKEVEKQSSG